MNSLKQIHNSVWVTGYYNTRGGTIGLMITDGDEEFGKTGIPMDSDTFIFRIASSLRYGAEGVRRIARYMHTGRYYTNKETR